MDNLDDVDQQSMESALRESEQRLRAILETAVEGIVTIDERGAIESINPAASRIFGYTAEEIIGQNVSVLMPSPDREKHDGYIANYLRTGEWKIIGIGREVIGLCRNGSVFPMELFKHSQATRIDIELIRSPVGLELTVRDNGHGIRAKEFGEGIGLQTMEQRAKLMGGKLSLQGVPNGGFAVKCEVTQMMLDCIDIHGKQN